MTDTSFARFRPIFFSVLLLAYFIGLLLVNYFKLDFVLIGVFTELLTIPALMTLVVYFCFNLWKSFKAKREQRSIHRSAAGILLTCIGLVVWASL